MTPATGGDLVGCERPRDGDHGVAQLLAAASGAVGGFGQCRVHGSAARADGGEPDAQPRRIRLRVCAITCRGRGSEVRIALHVAGRRVERRRAVPDRPCQHVCDAHPVPALTAIRRRADPPARGLEPEQSAVGGRDANGSAAVGRVRQREHAGGYRRSRPAARSSGAQPLAPGVVCRAEARGLRARAQAELRGVGLRGDDEPGLAIPADELRVVVGHVAGKQPAATGHRHPGDGRGQVLDGERNPAKRPVREPLLDGLPSQRLVHRDHRVQRGVACFDRCHRQVQQLVRRDLALAHQGGQAEPVVRRVLRQIHGRASRVKIRVTQEALHLPLLGPVSQAVDEQGDHSVSARGVV